MSLPQCASTCFDSATRALRLRVDCTVLWTGLGIIPRPFSCTPGTSAPTLILDPRPTSLLALLPMSIALAGSNIAPEVIILTGFSNVLADAISMVRCASGRLNVFVEVESPSGTYREGNVHFTFSRTHGRM